MLTRGSILVSLLWLLEQIPTPSLPGKRKRGRQELYSDKPFVAELAKRIGQRWQRDEHFIWSIVFQSNCLIYLYLFGSVRRDVRVLKEGALESTVDCQSNGPMQMLEPKNFYCACP